MFNTGLLIGRKKNHNFVSVDTALKNLKGN